MIDRLIEVSSKAQVNKVRRKIINGLVEGPGKNEVGNGGGEMIHRAIEAILELEGGDLRRKMIDMIIEVVAKQESF